MKLNFDEIGKKLYETGVQDGVLYPRTSTGTYPLGVAWNGLINITETPTGAEITPLYADNRKYLSLMSTEELGLKIEAYTYPEEFMVCDGTAEIAPGVLIGQQRRTVFGLAYKTRLGNDVENTDYGYKLHLIYGGLASPSEKAYNTVNDTPEAITFSWDVTTTPVNVTGFKQPTASLVIDSTKVDGDKLKLLEDLLYGVTADTTVEPPITAVIPHLLLPDEVLAIVSAG